ncbi:TetR/AcrR family transcriptional regulator [Acutalibacter intestini]|uniref:TetR/AcrR family transcriptional regulator n=1 Tax=Acutalibacter intestini TaxID=3093659 RepID=UPI002AC8E258|nr:TetR/AcrR family transcriptional regulator [Acutalibacter sp. M00204]
MPKQRITKDQVLQAAFQLARQGGMERVLVKSIAEKLGCSVQPIYSYCQNMEALRREVEVMTEAFVRQYAAARADPGNPFSSTGRAYIQLAREEPNLFRIFVLHRRVGVQSLEDLRQTQADPCLAEQLAQELGLSLEGARRLHLNMLLYTVGLGAVCAITDISPQEIFAWQEQGYQAFLAQALNQKEAESDE